MRSLSFCASLSPPHPIFSQQIKILYLFYRAQESTEQGLEAASRQEKGEKENKSVQTGEGMRMEKSEQEAWDDTVEDPEWKLTS